MTKVSNFMEESQPPENAIPWADLEAASVDARNNTPIHVHLSYKRPAKTSFRKFKSECSKAMRLTKKTLWTNPIWQLRKSIANNWCFSHFSALNSDIILGLKVKLSIFTSPSSAGWSTSCGIKTLIPYFSRLLRPDSQISHLSRLHWPDY